MTYKVFLFAVLVFLAPSVLFAQSAQGMKAGTLLEVTSSFSVEVQNAEPKDGVKKCYVQVGGKVETLKRLYEQKLLFLKYSATGTQENSACPSGTLFFIEEQELRKKAKLPEPKKQTNERGGTTPRALSFV